MKKNLTILSLILLLNLSLSADGWLNINKPQALYIDLHPSGRIYLQLARSNAAGADVSRINESTLEILDNQYYITSDRYYATLLFCKSMNTPLAIFCTNDGNGKYLVTHLAVP